MVKYIEALPLIAVSPIHEFSIIAQCKLIRFYGSWSLEKIEIHFVDEDKNLNFDYLVHINQSNNLVHPDDIDGLKRLLGKAQSGKPCKIKFRIIPPDGSIWRVEGLGNLQTPEQNSGEIDECPPDIKDGVCVENRMATPQIKNRKTVNNLKEIIVGDSSKHNRGEKSLQQNADLLQSIVDGIPGKIALMDVVWNYQRKPVDFVITVANKAMADFTGIKAADLIGRSMSDLHPERLRYQLQDCFHRVFNNGAPLFLELFYPELKKWFAVFVTKQVHEIGLVTAFLDITEQKAGEEHRKKSHLLSELNQAKTEFFNNVSHEFRTPLTLMLGPLNDVLKKVCEKSLNHEDFQKLQMVQRNALRLQKMVNTLMDFSRMEAGRIDGIFQPTDLAEFTTQLAGNFRSVVEKAGLKLIVNCQSTEFVYINHDMWEKIVFNLLSNAFKFTFEGKIEVSLMSYKRHVQLHIADTGIGISPSNMPQIFDRFIRIPNARSRTYEGTGIGLSLVKDFVQIHGGKIKVKSKEGKGAVFIVCIPLGKDHLPAKNIYEMKGQRAENNLSSIYEEEALNWLPDESLMLPFSKIGLHLKTHYNGVPEDHKQVVLLVDDNADMRDYIKSVLCSRYKVITAHNGKKALELLSADLKPDLVLADLMMPEMDGISLLSEMKGNDKTARIPVVILSARASEEDRIQGMKYGAEDYLVKPFSSLELIARVDCRIRYATQVKENAL